MKFQPQVKAQALEVYHRYWDSYTKGDLETFASTLDDQFEMIGTSESERCHTKADGIEFLKAQLHEVVGKAEMRNRQIDVVPVDHLVLINEQCDIYVLIGSDWNFYSKIRISTLLRETKEGWKVTQQHGSLPDMRVREGETIALEKISKENLELRDAVKRRTAELEHKNRELAIEAALERVRAMTMAMRNSQDVGKCIVRMFSELTALGVDESTRFGIGILNHENENIQLWTASKDGEDVHMHIGHLDMRWHPLLKSARKAWKAQEFLHLYVLEGEDLLNYYQMINNAPDYKLQVDLKKLPQQEFHYGFVFEHGFFYAFSAREFHPELIHITKRFSSLFEQTYRRYLDLVRAESQAREAEIELALERVRARTMAMHHTEELKEVIQVVFDQLIGLNIHVEHAGFILDYKEREDMHIWLADHQQGVPTEITIPYFDSPHWNSYLEAKAKQESFFANLLPFEVKNKFYRDLFEWIPELTEEAQQAIFSKPALAISTVLMDTVGLYIEHYSEIPFAAEENKILNRFGKVFQQTYTRFLDLQKAEAQAREAQIQLSLERVRARTMAMKNSEELADVSYLLNKQVVDLGVPTWGCAFNIYGEHDSTEWFSNLEGTFPAYKTPRENIFLRYYEAGQRGESLVIEEFGGERIKELYRYFASLNDSGDETIDNHVANAPEYQLNHMAYFKYGYLLFVTLVPSPEAHEIFVRFAKEFEQTYTRFLDLKKAEAQAREAQIEAALEKVRSRTMAMQNSEELADAAYVLFEQLNILGVTHERINIGIVNEDNRTIDFWVTEQGGQKLQTKFSGRISEPTTLSKSYEAWKRGAKSLVVDLKGGELQTWLRYLEEEIKIPFNKAYLHNRRVQTAGFFSKGMLVVTSPEPLQDEALYLLEKFAKVFDLTYTRFNDLLLAEAQAIRAKENLEAIHAAKSKAEEALTELKATQSQLVQQEKLASLGQLTAGIAHEIKNPLNFVNNFSEVSLELIEEAMEEIAQIEANEHASESAEILADIKSNLTKIHEHGTRANSIVSSMLQHSRGGSGKMEPTDLNALIKEYVNLSFHGMRAGKNPIDVEIDLNLDSEIKEVPLIKEDFSRVIINLCNNAFDAMRGKKYEVPSTKYQEVGGNGLDYLPKLRVSTILKNGQVRISFEDNGPGIPDEIKDKILQPFFTTKKGTEGTGLGLSITHDIVKAHGGELRVESPAAGEAGEVGGGTVFTFYLPINP